jgi:hypothetical protein
MNNVLHFLASAAPITFGALVGSIAVLNMVAWLIYRRQTALHRRLLDSVKRLSNEGGVRTVAAKAHAHLQEVDELIAEFEILHADELTPEMEEKVTARLQELRHTRERAFKNLAQAQKNVTTLEAYTPAVEKIEKEFADLRQKLHSSQGWELLLFRLITRWQEYFGNRAPVPASRKRSNKERADD